MRGRSWRWLRVRILGLLDAPPLGFREVAAGKDKTRREPLWATRIQTVIYARERPTE